MQQTALGRYGNSARYGGAGQPGCMIAGACIAAANVLRGIAAAVTVSDAESGSSDTQAGIGRSFGPDSRGQASLYTCKDSLRAADHKSHPFALLLWLSRPFPS